MAFKFKKKIGDQEHEFELTGEEIAEQAKSDSGLLMDLLGKAGFKFEKDESEKKEDNKEKEMKTNNQADDERLAKLESALSKVAESVNYLTENAKKGEQDKEASAKAELKKTAKSEVEKAISEGRIAAGEKDEWIEDYVANPRLVKKSLERLPIDPGIKRKNAESGAKDGSDQGGQDSGKTEGKKSGGNSFFTLEEIEKMSPADYEKNRPSIMDAMKNGHYDE
jgi:hypothetical protein